MRGTARNPFKRLIETAVRAMLKEQSDSGLIPPVARHATATSPPQYVTTAGETEDGVIYTERIFMLGLDALGAPGANLLVQGKTKNYGS